MDHPRRTGRGVSWGEDLDATLRGLADSPLTYREIASLLGVSEQAAKTRACHLRILRDKAVQFARHSKALIEKFDAESREIRDIAVWKRRVLARDKYTCVDCGLHCPSIAQVHHVVPRVDAPELVFATDNGATLCPNCHALRHVSLGRGSSGRRLSKQEKDYIYLSILDGKSRLEIASHLGVNIKTVNSIAKQKD